MAYNLTSVVLNAQAKQKRGIVLMLHGGSWESNDYMSKDAGHYAGERWAKRGWKVYIPTYDRGRGAPASTLAAYDELRKRNPKHKILVVGFSAGGHLALLLASKRKLDGVIVEAPPSDLRPPLPGPAESIVNALWSHNERVALSPILLPLKTPEKRILITHAYDDPLVPVGHSDAYKREHPGIRLLHLRSDLFGPIFSHAWIAKLDQARVFAAERKLASSI